MTTIYTLLSRGFFPRELPPPFTTILYGQFIAKNSGKLPQDFTDGKKSTQLLRHDAPHFGIKRRLLGIPNPITQYNLSATIIQNWATLDGHCHKSIFSCSTPKFNIGKGQAIVPFHGFDELSGKSASVRSFARYILRIDIAGFYRSIYSHSIPWALHTKTVAKARRKDKTLLGNKLDERVRKGQDDQTIGIPIGPDTSFVIAETILTAFDELLVSKYGRLRGFRYVDDMEFGFGTYREAQETLALIRDSLREFELSVNETKTKIFELPFPIDGTWVADLRRFEFRESKSKYLQSDIATYFDKVFSLQKQFPEDTVLKYAVQRLRSIKFDTASWQVAERYLFQCLMVDTSTFLVILPLLQNHENNGHKIDLASLGEILNYQIQQCCPMYYGNEVAWALWAAIYWKIQINEKAAVALSNMMDSVAAIIALDARHRKLISKGLDTTRWEQYMTKESLYEQHWLLAYEANRRGWLPLPSGKDYVAGDACFGMMKAAKVSFYDPEKANSVKLTSVAPSNTVVPLFSF